MDQDLINIDESEKNLLIPPQTHIDFTIKKSNQPPDFISYEIHPAYADFIRSATLKEKLRSSLIFGAYCIKVLTKRAISYELIPAHLRKPESRSAQLNLVKQLVRNIYNKVTYKKITPIKKAGENIFVQLAKQGVCVVGMSPEQFESIETEALPLINSLRNIRSKKSKPERDFLESRSTALMTEHRALFQVVESVFIKNGLLDAASKYLGHPVTIIDINPQINDSSDNFWENFYSDLDIPHPETAYCHRDASGGDIKIIIYLSDVNVNNGPFCFTVGSHKNRPNRIDNLIQEINDTSGFSSPAYKGRKAFAALPAFLRKKCSFGTDIFPGSLQEKQIRASEWQITAKRGHAVIFDPKGIHRGGMVVDDERIVLTCIIG